MSGRVASVEERKEWVAAFIGGETQASIARRVGVSKTTLCHAMQKHMPVEVQDKRAARRLTLALDERHMSRTCHEVFGRHAAHGSEGDESARLVRQFALARCILLDLRPEDLASAYGIARVAKREEVVRWADMGCT